MDSIANICRLCLKGQQGTTQLHNLFGQNLLSMKIMSLFQLTLMHGANWPQNVCTPCSDRLNEMCLFRREVIDNQIIIEQRYGPVVLQSTSVPLATTFISETPVTETVQIAELEDTSAFERTTTPPPTIKATRRSTRSTVNSSSVTISSSPPAVEESPTPLPPPPEEDPSYLEDDEQAHEDSASVDETIAKFMRLTCCLCPTATEFPTFTQLRQHFTRTHSCKGYVMCCNVKHLRRHKLHEHVLFHLDPTRFRCPTCAKTFNSAHNLNTHQLMRHLPEDQRRHPCDQCQLRFGTPFQLKQHKMRHVTPEERSFQCEHCDKRFPGRPHLLSHLRFMHEQRKEYSCPHCQSSFTGRTQLQSHLAAAHGQPETPTQKVRCEHCDKLFANDASMRKHLSRINTTGEKCVCAECGHESPNKAALRGHMDRNHNPNRKAHVCDTCGKQFRSTTTLTEHMAKHTGQSLYTCLFCPKRFNSNANRYAHQKKMHPTEWAQETRRKTMGEQ